MGTLRDAVQVRRAPHWECARCKTVVLCYGDFTAIIPKTAKAKTNQFIRPHRTSRGCLTSQQLPGRRWVQVQGRRALGETPRSQGTSRPPAPPPPGIQTCFSGGSGSISRGWGLSWEGKSPWPMEGPGQGQVQPPPPRPPRSCCQEESALICLSHADAPAAATMGGRSRHDGRRR